jgi:hypothetical protein
MRTTLAQEDSDADSPSPSGLGYEKSHAIV